MNHLRTTKEDTHESEGRGMGDIKQRELNDMGPIHQKGDNSHEYNIEWQHLERPEASHKDSSPE
jgi:hypothetical protein